MTYSFQYARRHGYVLNMATNPFKYRYVEKTILGQRCFERKKEECQYSWVKQMGTGFFEFPGTTEHYWRSPYDDMARDFNRIRPVGRRIDPIDPPLYEFTFTIPDDEQQP